MRTQIFPKCRLKLLGGALIAHLKPFDFEKLEGEIEKVIHRSDLGVMV